MGLLSFLKRKPGAAAAASGPAPGGPVDAVQQARVLARQRLIGAVILVIVGVIGFPLVFETQPRPIPVDIPIELPRKENAAPLAVPARPASAVTAAALDAAPAEKATSAAGGRATDGVLTETAADAGRELPRPTPAPTPPQVRAASRPDPVKAVAPTATPPKADPRVAADAERARELLAGKAPADRKTADTGTTEPKANDPTSAQAKPAAATAGRFVLQVGAFADAAAAQQTRLKAEKLGLKTYTQAASTSAGQRIRVRVGPFGTRDEADRALAKARSAGLSAVVLTL